MGSCRRLRSAQKAASCARLMDTVTLPRLKAVMRQADPVLPEPMPLVVPKALLAEIRAGKLGPVPKGLKLVPLERLKLFSALPLPTVTVEKAGKVKAMKGKRAKRKDRKREAKATVRPSKSLGLRKPTI